MRIAQRFNVGSQARGCVSPEGTADSFPEVPFVVGNPMFLEQSQELLLESHFAMMVLLVSDVLNGFFQQRLIITCPSVTDFDAFLPS